MTAQDIVLALGLPDSCRVDQRVPKKLLVENGAPTTADKRQINDGIEELHWLAALKPNTIGVPEYRDGICEYLEIAVLSVTLREGAKVGRLAELVHRAIPYPVVLLSQSPQNLMLSLAHKRWAQNEAGKVVLDGGAVGVVLPDDAPSSTILQAFTGSLALGRQPQTTLYELYQGWTSSLFALLAAKLTGVFYNANTPTQAAIRRQALQECQQLEREVASLTAKAAKEKQLARQVALNLEIKRVQAHLVTAKERL